MNERENLHEHAIELQEALDETTAEIERVRVAPAEDLGAVEKRARAREERHARKVKALGSEIASAEKELAVLRTEIEDARMELERANLAGEKRTYPEGRTVGYVLFAIGLACLLYTCLQLFMR